MAIGERIETFAKGSIVESCCCRRRRRTSQGQIKEYAQTETETETDKEGVEYIIETKFERIEVSGQRQED